MMLKKIWCDELVKKINDIDTNRIVKKKKDSNNRIKYIENKTPTLASTTALNAKINEVKDEISCDTDLATTTSPNDVKENTPDVSILVKKADCDTKIVEIEKKRDHDNLTAKKFLAKIKTSRFKNFSWNCWFRKKIDILR